MPCFNGYSGFFLLREEGGLIQRLFLLREEGGLIKRGGGGLVKSFNLQTGGLLELLRQITLRPFTGTMARLSIVLHRYMQKIFSCSLSLVLAFPDYFPNLF